MAVKKVGKTKNNLSKNDKLTYPILIEKQYMFKQDIGFDIIHHRFALDELYLHKEPTRHKEEIMEQQKCAKSYLEELYGDLAADPYKVDKYGHAGIYSISLLLDDREILVYIGKSRDMLKRLSSHMNGTLFETKSNKYKVLETATRRGIKIKFDVIEDCPIGDNEGQDEWLGLHEGMWIRYYMPPLNYQIPKAGDWKHWNVQKSAKYITLNDILM